MSRIPLVAGNWKMNGRRAMAREQAGAIAPAVPDGVEVLVCPPFPYLDIVAQAAKDSRLGLGAQNMAAETDGAHTGEVSGEMLRDMGCTHVILGHSERRAAGEDDATVAAKVARALDAGLTPIICVGETLAEREADTTLAVVHRQLGAVLDHVDVAALAGAVVAYEPVWAIGTGRTATPDQAQQVHAALREFVAARDREVANALRLLYGGSVKADNAASLMGRPDIDGGLIGGASLDADSFLAICQAAVS